MRFPHARAVVLAAFIAAPLATSTHAGAVGTRTFVLDTLDKLSGGDLKGVAVSSDGADRAGTGLFAATGPDGRVFRVEPNGTSSVYFRSTETHLVSIALAENGDLLAGSSGKGQLFRITGPGRATVMADLPGEEVKGVAAAKGFTWAIANEYGEPPEPPKRNPAVGRNPPGPTAPGARMKAGKSA